MIWRRRGRGTSDPEEVLRDARSALDSLRGTLAAFRANLDELEAEVKRDPHQEEV